MELSEQKLSVMRRYPLETLITALFLAISALTGVVYSNTQDIKVLNAELKMNLKEDSKVLIQALDKNTEALNRIDYNNSK